MLIKPTAPVLGCLAWVVLASISSGEQKAAGVGPKVMDLRCEYLSNPVGIDVAQPRFGWKLDPVGVSRGLKQSAWQVVVETASGAPLWDSGKVGSEDSVNRSYAGKALQSSQDCRWKVRVWGRDGQEGPWSEPARFVTGLMDPKDWKGSWIRNREAPHSRHIWYRKSFDLDQVPESAFVHLASIGYHELYINGERIGTEVLAPDVTNLNKRVLYVSYDVRAQLRPGKNVIGVWTGSGWAEADGSFGKGVWEQDSVFRCQAEFSNGTTLFTDSTWKCQVSSSENRGRWKGGGQGEYGGEVIDARMHQPEWNRIGFDDSKWLAASTYDRTIELSAQMLEPTRKVKVIKPIKVTHANGRSTFDMGRNFTGWIEFDLRNGKEGQTVIFMTANRPEMVEEYDQRSVYIHDASGVGTFSHRFNYNAGRWITVEGLGYEPTIEDMRCHMVTNDRRRIGQFECSKPMFNRIYETDLDTYVANTVNGVTMDCPHRERYGYGEIVLSCSWGCGIPNFESAAFYRKVTQDWFDVQRKDGFVNTIAPQIYQGAGGTLWSSAPVTASWEFQRAYGDVRQLEHAYEPMKRWVDYLHRFVSADGVLTAYESASRFLGDWATPHGSEYGNTEAAKLFNNCVYAYCLQVMVESARILGRDDDGKTYAERLAALRPNVHRQFFNEATGQYIDGRQLAMAFPLYVGITPEPLRESVMAKFVEEISVRKPYLDTGSSGLPILLKFMVEHAERSDLLFACLAREEQPGYGYFLKRGETTWPEYWPIDGEPSRIHTCYTGISGYFIRGIAGIGPDPTEGGMKRFMLKPKLVGDMTWAKASSESLYGKIVSNWTREGKTATFEMQVPPNSTATVFIPTAKIADLRESGGDVEKAAGVRFISMQDRCAVLELDSGVYRFISASAAP